jgi:peptidoglycan/xylan/chitin deacetylase (PgdA/CDA1 family)
VETGRVEVQAHGYNHAYIQDYTDLEVIEEEIYRPIDEIETRFGATPQAFIWPGGNFTAEAVQVAREAGYQIGFTVYSRGPLMYNRIPLGAPEQAVEDPLMVLPRAWSSAADVALNQALRVSEAAEAQAEEVRRQEQLYLSLYCSADAGE